MKPTEGRIVHYNGGVDAPRIAAMVIMVHNDETVNLKIFYPNGADGFLEKVKQGEGYNTWNWPPRV